ncbi:hypothetical protein D1610_11830 [Sphingomonas gilva]|uniref:Tryptophan 7-halogenase n=1 Tax=Sphingomonas gilva TaxID=2305907 RepID=A0A396RLN5_9SPHN|nr:tryptophan 7-halogenase [Sphingomonas gilva]RHW17228.1 hypothetical protein D1610_11830 [Sphingomonas gilva]
MARPVRSVAIVGRGPPLWLAAIALHRAFAATGLAVTVVETPSAGPSHDVVAALPDLARFHRLLGIGDAELIRHADAGFSLGQQFAGWSGGEDAFIHGYGETGEAIGDLPFAPLWVRARAGGLRVGFEAFNAAAAGARLGRIDPAGPHGYHLDAAGYQRLLARHAARMGIKALRDPAPCAEAAEGHVSRVRLSDGQTIEADLYVDAGDGAGALIGALDPAPRYVAGRGSPCDRMLTASAPPLAPLPLYSRIAAHRAGWVGLFPLASRTGVALAYAGDTMSDDEAARLLRAQTGKADIALRHIGDRIRERPWIGNCVAIGAAAAGGDPIDAVELHRHQIAISHLISLLPVDRENMVEAGIFNEDVVAHLARVRDFQAAHYHLNGRAGEDFWDAARGAPVSAELAAKIDLFGARAMLAQHNHESFNADSWYASLIGHGIVPRSWDPQADRLPDAELIGRLQAMLSGVKQKVDAMIPHQAAREAA